MNISDVLKKSSAQLDVELGNIINNYNTLSSASPGASCAAVVKANAYGLGLEKVVPAIYYNTRCNIFFVASLSEAITLRSILVDATIYVFDGLFQDQVDTYLTHNIRPILNDLNQIKMWNGRRQPCAIHFDTGINRLGLSKNDTEKFLNSTNDLNITHILSHLINSEDPDHKSNIDQLNKFTKITRELKNIPASLSNSAGIYLGANYHFDLVRPGIMLYGGNPGLPKRPSGIHDVITLSARILQIRNLNPGMSVGYKAIWTARQPSRVALLNVGYADGIFKTSDRNAQVFVAGALAPVIGKVSMDMIAVDITERVFDGVGVTDIVEILGSHITLEMIAKVSTLEQYEILTGIGFRYNKNYNLRI
ncbi:MAG: alanine racemase [Emcibacteraceae bacterium]|jgi:alanine racemase|nr:alanine racemase [Kordiimonadaceae bacterium]MDC0112022.1 alanine racemase [Emcibacteraceae bacterium]|tara:strand:- start:10257 stop:11348 length:1092 start_codon:yes stop_codon:yes gene_type:complete